MSRLSIVHWNDAYRVGPQRISPNSETIDVTQFAALLDDIRCGWNLRSDGTRDGLSLFSGDLFSPSVESTITRGSHMVPVINKLAPDVALTGNHEFDFGYPHLSKLVMSTKFPWLLSNILDESTGNVPEHLHSFQVLERSGVRVGIIGLVEEDWISIVPDWPPHFKYQDMAEIGRKLSERLRKEYRCDLVIALTHSRLPNDIQLAKDLLASSPSAQNTHSVTGEQGVDIILGGHDHFYFVSKGVTTWEGHKDSELCLGSEGDNGDVLVVKSGTDFRELSELTLELEDTPPGSVRKKVIRAVHGKRHEIQPAMPSSKSMQKIIDGLLPSISKALKVPVCVTKVELDLRSQSLRAKETAAANWFADALRHAYDDVLYAKYGSGADGVLICAGTLRADTLYAPGELTLENILEILPFDDPVVVLELDGKSLWDAIEAGVSKYPAREGGFPIVSGLRVSWDSRRPPGQRVLGVWLLRETLDVPSEKSGTSDSYSAAPALVDGEFIAREENGRTYKIVTREYIATGHCGYTALPGHAYLTDPEQGQPMSSLVKAYLVGGRRIVDDAQLDEKRLETERVFSDMADTVVGEEIGRRVHHARGRRFRWPEFVRRWQRAITDALRKLLRARTRSNAPSQEHAREKIQKERGGRDNHGYDVEKTHRERLCVIHPVVDGRFKDVARS